MKIIFAVLIATATAAPAAAEWSLVVKDPDGATLYVGPSSIKTRASTAKRPFPVTSAWVKIEYPTRPPGMEMLMDIGCEARQFAVNRNGTMDGGRNLDEFYKRDEFYANSDMTSRYKRSNPGPVSDALIDFICLDRKK